MDREAAVRAYYRALDEGDEDRLHDLLAPAFVQERPDRRFEGRDRFVSFMREERPRTDTRHPIEAIYRVGDSGARRPAEADAGPADGAPADSSGNGSSGDASADDSRARTSSDASAAEIPSDASAAEPTADASPGDAAADDSPAENGSADGRAGHLAVQGRLEGLDGEVIARFVDVFRFDGDEIARLDTYTQ